MFKNTAVGLSILALSAFILLSFTTPTLAKPLSLYEIQEATCQIFAGRVQGTGTCADENDTHYMFLTNAHVVKGATNVKIYIFAGGYKSKAIPGTVSWRAYKERTLQDLAIVKVEKGYFGDNPPRVIPIAPPGYAIKPRSFLCSAGCPRSQWPMSFVGHITDTTSWLKFQPAPDSGQSGSSLLGLVEKNGEYFTRICGVITWTDANLSNGIGGAVPISVLYGFSPNADIQKYAPRSNVRIPSSFKEVPYYIENNVVENHSTTNYATPQPMSLVYNDENSPEYAVNIIDGNISVSNTPQYAIANGDQLDTQACGPDGCNIWPFNRGGGQPIIPPQGILRPREQNPMPLPENNNGGGGASPFEQPLPNMGGIWPGEPQTTPPQTTPPQSYPETPNLDGSIANTPPPTWFQYFRGNGQGLFQALGLAGLIGVIAVAWRTFLRKRVQTTVDRLQNNFETVAAQKVGPELAASLRDVWEAVEQFAMGTADQVFQSTQQAKNNVLAQKRATLQSILSSATKTAPTNDTSTLEDLLARAAADPAETDITPEVAAKIANIVKNTGSGNVK